MCAANAAVVSANSARRKEDSDMLIRNWHKWAAVIACGAMLLQVPACSDAALAATAASSVVTAGGVIYIISRIMQ
jgi:hypothetical protein